MSDEAPPSTISKWPMATSIIVITLAMVGLVAVAVLGQIGTTSAAAANSAAALTATSLAQARLEPRPLPSRSGLRPPLK